MDEQQEQKQKSRLGRFFRWGALLLALVLVWQIVSPSIVNLKSILEREPVEETTAQEYFDMASDAIEAEDYEGALLLLENARALSGEDGEMLAQILLTTASTHILTGDWSLAKQALDDTLAVAPEETQALLLRAQLSIENGDYPAAIADVLTYLDIEPEDGDTRQTLAQLMEAQQDYEAAAGQYEILYSQEPEEKAHRLNALRCLFLCGQYSEAIEGFDAYIQELDGGEDPYGGIAAFLRGACLMQLGDYSTAAESFENAHFWGYDQAACLEQIIVCRFEEENYEALLTAGEALAGLDTSMVTSLKDAWQRVGIGAVYLGEYETALNALERAAEIDPALEGNAYYRGICLLSLNRTEEAVEAFTLSIEQGFLTQFCYYNRGVCYVSLLEYEKALEDMVSTLGSGEDEELTQAAQALEAELREYLELSEQTGS